MMKRSSEAIVSNQYLTGSHDTEYKLLKILSLETFILLTEINKTINKIVTDSVAYKQLQKLKGKQLRYRLPYCVEKGYYSAIVLYNRSNRIDTNRINYLMEEGLRRGHVKIVRYLYSQCMNNEKVAIIWNNAYPKYLKFDNDSTNQAVKSGNLEMVKYMVSLGADPLADNDRALQLASCYGYLEIIKYLISLGANVQVNNNYAIRMASTDGHLDVVKYLVSLGADPQANDNEAIRCASEYGHLDTVKYLVSLGADLTANDNYAIKSAYVNKHIEVFKFLISLNGDPTILNYLMTSALVSNDLDTIKLLVSLGADPNQ